jgi:hypothetical protein
MGALVIDDTLPTGNSLTPVGAQLLTWSVVVQKSGSRNVWSAA